MWKDKKDNKKGKSNHNPTNTVFKLSDYTQGDSAGRSHIKQE